MNNLWVLQQAIYTALTASSPAYPTYDAVPQGTLKPYIVIGEFLADPDEELAAPTTDAALSLHTWSATAGKSQSHAMLDFIRLRLDGQVIGGAWAISEDNAMLMEDAGSTATARIYHGVARYRVRVG